MVQLSKVHTACTASAIFTVAVVTTECTNRVSGEPDKVGCQWLCVYAMPGDKIIKAQRIRRMNRSLFYYFGIALCGTEIKAFWWLVGITSEIDCNRNVSDNPPKTTVSIHERGDSAAQTSLHC